MILCADDYGLNEAVSQSICQLISLNRLQATSCLVNQPNLQAHANALLQVTQAHKAEVGLHLNLTEGQFLSIPSKRMPPLHKLILKTYGSRLNRTLFQHEIAAQFDAFCQAFGQLPDFIDGHQHVHQLPQIRALIIALYQQHLTGSPAWIRSTSPSISARICRSKVKLLSLLGGKTFKRLLQQHRIPHNPFFSGIYDFSPAHNYRELFLRWQANSPPNTLMMCHPAMNNSPNDAIAQSRWQEFCYFKSEAFERDRLHIPSDTPNVWTQ